MWKIIGESVAGTSHLRAGLECQDFCHYTPKVVQADSSQAAFYIAIADGAGSALRARRGAEASVDHIVASVDRLPHEVERDYALSLVRSTRDHLQHVAEAESITLDALACTILFCGLGAESSFFMQVGDGCWVAEKDGKLLAVTWPYFGEYVNETTFLTARNAEEAMQFCRVDEPLAAVAGFTDGVQALALNYAKRKVHNDFFLPMFHELRHCEDATMLLAPLRGFLNSKPVNDRTSDDKTLVLACRIEDQSDAAADRDRGKDQNCPETR